MTMQRQRAWALNKSHVAARGGGLVFAANLSNYLQGYDYAGNVLGSAAVVSGQPSVGVSPDGIFGQCLNLGSTSTSIQVGFPGHYNGAVAPGYTFGICVTFQSTGFFFLNSSSGGGAGIRNNGTTISFHAINLSQISAGTLTITNNVPYFIGVAVPGNVGTTGDYIAKNLWSGVTQIAAGVASGPNIANAGDGKISLGGFSCGSSAQCYIASAALVYRKLSLQELSAWANDPWGLLNGSKRRFSWLNSAGAAAAYLPYDPWPQQAPILAQ